MGSVAAEPWVELHIPCEACDGLGSVEDFGVRGGRKPCPVCRGTKVDKEPIPLSSLQRLLKEIEESADN